MDSRSSLDAALGVTGEQLTKHAPARPANRRADGTFAPGVSGNPRGRPPKNRGERWDGWSNLLTGHGTIAKDSRMSSTFAADTVSPEEGIELHRGDDIAARVIETWPNEMLREGFNLRVNLDEDTEGSADDAKELQEIVKACWDDLGLEDALWNCIAWERGQGGAAMFLGVNDGATSLEEELIVDRVSSFDFITAFEPTELVPWRWYTNPMAPKYGQVAVWQLTPIASVGMSVDGSLHRQMVNIHESRLITFPGIRVTRRSFTGLNGWGDSVLTRMRNVIRDHNMSWESAAVLLKEFGPAVMKMKGLMELVANDQGKVFENRLKAMVLARATVGATLIDSEEDFQRQQTPVTGLPDLLDRFMSRLAAAADMPLTLLMGQSPGGLNATGESDIRFFYDRIAAVQRKRLKPVIERVTRLIFQAKGIEEPEKWSVRFNSLWQLSAKEQAESRKTQSETDKTYMEFGVASPADIARSRFGGDEYSFETNIDFKEREEAEQLEAAQAAAAELEAAARAAAQGAPDPTDPETPNVPPPPPLPPGYPGGEGEEGEDGGDFSVLGPANGHSVCELCGRTDLKRMVTLQPPGGGDPVHYGLMCAARLLGCSTREVSSQARSAGSAPGQEEE